MYDETLKAVLKDSCEGLSRVDSDILCDEVIRNLFEGATEEETLEALILVARSRIEMEPNYSYVCARILLTKLIDTAFGLVSHIPVSITFEGAAMLYPKYFEEYIYFGIYNGILDKELSIKFDLKSLGSYLDPKRDLNFTYLSLQTLHDRYFLHKAGVRYEMPQAFFMRVAMGLALNEDNPTEKAKEFYDVMSTFRYMPSTPTLFNSGTIRPQLSSCYLTTVPDDLGGIYDAIKDNALLSKYAGGLGNDWTPVRAMGSHIKGTNGKSQGIVPFLNVANATTIAVNQGGKRKGATCAYLECWHADVEEFLELRKNTGDDRRRTHDMNTALWVPDLFMERVEENGNWTLFSPELTPDLHDSYGEEFKSKYIAYEETGIGKTISAIKLWRKMLSMVFETGHPWITFKDACNIRSPQRHMGVVHSSNLCTEITLNTSADEIAVCNLGSINLDFHTKKGYLDKEELLKTVNTAVRMLDNVIDINFYPVPQAKNSNLKHRPIGLGIMGFQDALYNLDIPYASDEAVSFADMSMEVISYYAINASCGLAKERGFYSTYKGSLWDQGYLPIDTINLLQENRNEFYQSKTQELDWKELRSNVAKYGVRNSNIMAIAPTATIANICNVTQSIEPTYQNLFVKSNLSGEFAVFNQHLFADLMNLNIWNVSLLDKLKLNGGSVQNIDEIPKDLKAKYKTAFEIDPLYLVKCASARQKWIDQAQSLNIYMAQPSGKKLHDVYMNAWKYGLKTTYYLRSLGATSAEKSTVNSTALNAVKVPKACSITDPDCDACQ